MRTRFRRSGLTTVAVMLLVFAALSAGATRRTFLVRRQSSTDQPPNPPQVYRTTGSRIAIGRSIQVPRTKK